MATINSIDLGKLQQEKIKKDSGVVPMPLPDSESAETVLMPVTGPVTYINITGKKGGSFSDARTFISYLNDWITRGGQVTESNVTFIGDLNPSATVLDGYGVVTSATSSSITDDSKDWDVNAFSGYELIIVSGTGAGQSGTIISNSDDTVVISPSFSIIPDSTSRYNIKGPWSVRVISGGWDTNADEPNMVYYSLEMVQGTF